MRTGIRPDLDSDPDPQHWYHKNLPGNLGIPPRKKCKALGVAYKTFADLVASVCRLEGPAECEHNPEDPVPASARRSAQHLHHPRLRLWWPSPPLHHQWGEVVGKGGGGDGRPVFLSRIKFLRIWHTKFRFLHKAVQKSAGIRSEPEKNVLISS